MPIPNTDNPQYMGILSSEGTSSHSSSVIKSGANNIVINPPAINTEIIANINSFITIIFRVYIIVL